MSKKNRIVAKGLGITLSSVMAVGTLAPSAVQASDWAFVSEGEELLNEEVPAEGSDGVEDLFEDPTEPTPVPVPESTPDPGEDSFFVDPVDDGQGTIPSAEPEQNQDFWDDSTQTVTPSPETEIPVPIPEEVLRAEDAPEFVSSVSATPTPSATATPTAAPTPTPLTQAPVVITTGQISNLHAGKEFYLNSLKSRYALTFSDDFGRVMDEIEYEYLSANHLIRPDGSRGLTDTAYLENEQKKQEEQLRLQQALAAGGGLVVLDMVGDGFSSDQTSLVIPPVMESQVVLDDLGWVGGTPSVVDVPVAIANPEDGFTSGETTVVAGSTPEGLLARNWQDVLAVYVYQQNKVGALSFSMDRSAKPILAQIFAELNPIQVEGNEARYGNLHVTDYVKAHNIPRWDRGLLKQYTETDCKLLCATVTAAKGFIRQSVGDSVSEERVNVLAAAYSLVGKVGYFWGGKSTYLGMDPRWGMAQFVTSEGSSTSGSLRAYGLDCSGFVTWAVINGYQNQGMQSFVGDGTSEQWLRAKVVAEADAQPGDFVFQNGPEAGANNHVGILVGKTDSGDWIAVHCSSSQNGVTVGEAYSASFRYIREPSFYPPKVRVLAVSQENLDDIVVEADYERYDPMEFSDGTVQSAQDLFQPVQPSQVLATEIYNEDFMDIVLFEDAALTAAPAESGDILYEDVLNTGGLVVIDDSGRGDNLDYLTWPKNEICFEAAVEETAPAVSPSSETLPWGDPSSASFPEVVLDDLGEVIAAELPAAESPLVDASPLYEEAQAPLPAQAQDLVVVSLLTQEEQADPAPAWEETAPAWEDLLVGDGEGFQAEASYAPGWEEVVLDDSYVVSVPAQGAVPEEPREAVIPLTDTAFLAEASELVVLEGSGDSSAPAWDFADGLVSLDYVGFADDLLFTSQAAPLEAAPDDLMEAVMREFFSEGAGRELSLSQSILPERSPSDTLFQGALKREEEKEEESLALMQSLVVLE